MWDDGAEHVTCKSLMPSVDSGAPWEALKSSCTRSPGFGRGMAARACVCLDESAA